MRMVTLAVEHAKAHGWTVAVAIVDPSGGLVAAGRMDGVVPATFNIAWDKAVTTTMGRSTKAFGARMVSEPEMALGAANRPNTCAWEGGLPIFSAGVLVGGIGVSGASGHEDAACALAAIKAVGLSDQKMT